MRQYIDIMNHVLSSGKWQENRTGIRTLTTANVHFSHDMKDGFPLLTTKKMPLKTLLVELEGFIGGITDKRWYQERGCHIWSEWSNPKTVQKELDKLNSGNFLEDEYHQCNPDIKKDIQKQQSDLGPIYGYQWRNFGKQYGKIELEDFVEGGCCPATGQYQIIYKNVDGLGYFADIENNNFDQLKYIVETLKTNPNDRRMVCSAWNPNQLHLMALPACHIGFVVTHIEGELNLHWTQRSCDLFLGVPFNIASYATLLLLLCKESGMKPGNLSGMLCNCHVYENHIEQCKKQLGRETRDLPELEILSKPDGTFNIFAWEHSDVKLTGYNPHPKIKGDVAV